MSDSEEENFGFYGKPLEQYDEDSIPKRKPIAIEDQIATDSHGRRRFHGAFTGGFSAGFFNTVGSLEGWKPSEFKSSRSEKAGKITLRPEDFMDDEDMGEHGIAPQMIRATKDYATGKKRKRPAFSEGPIPGVPVLHSLIEAGNETIGYLLMKNMDLKPKRKDALEGLESLDNSERGTRVYGCEMPKTYEIQRNIERDDVIPKIFQEYIKNPKDNTFGLGYVGLDKTELSLRKSTQLVVRDQNNRKLAISGQAFGVGAFENDDEDIYAKDDMSQYDFEITKEKSVGGENRNFNHPVFVKGTEKLLNNKQYLPPTIPHSFSGKHKVRKSRFEPLATEVDTKKDEIKRKDMNAAIRAKYLGEEHPVPGPSKESSNTMVEKKWDMQQDSMDKQQNSREKQQNSSEKQQSSSEKQHKITENKEHTPTVMIKQETSLIFDKFVSASTVENPHDILEKVEPTYSEHGTKEMREAAKLKMYGPLTRVIIDWQPCSLLCKRFNIREPIFDSNRKDKKKKSQIFFEYEKHKEDNIPFKPGLLSAKDENIAEKMDLEEEPERLEINRLETKEKQFQTKESQFQTKESQFHAKEKQFQTNEKRFQINEKQLQTSEKQQQSTQVLTEAIEEEQSKQQEHNKEISIPKQEENPMDANEEPPKRIIEQTDRIDVAKNLDLFKAVFLSSSESESEDDSDERSMNKGEEDKRENKQEEDKREDKWENKQAEEKREGKQAEDNGREDKHAEDNGREDCREAIIKKNILTEELITKIKPRKEGILSNINFNLTPRKPEETVEEKAPSEVIEEKASLLVIEEKTSVEKDSFTYGPVLPADIPKLGSNDYKVQQESVDDEWIEKDELSKKINKHRKKHKKEKRKRNKEKHKKSKHRK